jgi:hypothetical protein
MVPEWESLGTAPTRNELQFGVVRVEYTVGRDVAESDKAAVDRTEVLERRDEWLTVPVPANRCWLS